MSYSAPDSDILYLTSLTTSGIAGYATLEKPPMTAGAEVELSQAVASSDGEVLLKAFVSPALGIESIPVGDFDFSIYGAVSAMDGVSEIVCRLYQRTLQGVETELFNFTTGEIDATTDSPTLYPVTYSTSDIIDTAITDRLVLKMYAKTDYATDITVSLYYLGETHQSRMFLPVNISKITGGDMLAALYDSNQDGMATSAAPANPLTALGDIIYGGDSDGTQTRLPIGTPGHRLTATSDGIVDWEAVTALVNPMTELGDIIYASDSDGAPSRLGAGTSGYYLRESTDGIPEWAAVSVSSLPEHNHSTSDAGGLLTFVFPNMEILNYVVPVSTTDFRSTSTDYIDISTTDYALPFTKLSSATNVIVDVITGIISSAADTVLDFGIYDGTNTTYIATVYIKTANVIMFAGGGAVISGLAAGNYTFTLRWRRTSGTGTMYINYNTTCTIKAIETA